MSNLNHSLSCFFLFASVAASAAAVAAEWQTRNVSMAEPENYFSEFCVPAEAGRTLDVELDSPHPVDFNVHFHTERETFFPVRERVDGKRAFEVPVERDGEYCLMWTNPENRPAAFTVNVRYRVR